MTNHEWESIKKKYSQSSLFDNIWDEKHLNKDMENLLLKERKEERERIVCKIDDLMAEFGDQPKQCLVCIAEYLAGKENIEF